MAHLALQMAASSGKSKKALDVSFCEVLLCGHNVVDSLGDDTREFFSYLPESSQPVQ
ncbi:MAG: hypothetical protein WA672_12155 [Candidatus Angelobacter sp.]